MRNLHLHIVDIVLVFGHGTGNTFNLILFLIAYSSAICAIEGMLRYLSSLETSLIEVSSICKSAYHIVEISLVMPMPAGWFGN